MKILSKTVEVMLQLYQCRPVSLWIATIIEVLWKIKSNVGNTDLPKFH